MMDHPWSGWQTPVRLRNHKNIYYNIKTRWCKSAGFLYCRVDKLNQMTVPQKLQTKFIKSNAPTKKEAV